MKKILILMGRYYPKPSANSICFQNVINNIPKDEYEIHIMAYDDGLDTDYDNKVIKFSRGTIQSVLYKNENTKKNSRLLPKVIRIIQKIRFFLCMPILPWSDPITTYREMKLAKNEYLKNRFDIVIAIHTPLSSLIVANKLKKENPEIRFVAYFLDSLSGGYTPRFVSKKWYEKNSIKLEKKLLNNADLIVFMKSSYAYHSRLYNGTPVEKRIVYLDLPMLTERHNMKSNSLDHVRLVYVGSLPASMRSPNYILKVFSEINDPSWELVFVGDSTCQILNEYSAKDKRIKVVGRCTHEEALKYENNASILLNLGNHNPNMAPSKVFEYMSWCKKIVSTYSIDEDTSIEYLKKYPQALLLDERKPIKESATALFEFAKLEEASFSYSDLLRDYYSNTPEAFIKIL